MFHIHHGKVWECPTARTACPVYADRHYYTREKAEGVIARERQRQQEARRLGKARKRAKQRGERPPKPRRHYGPRQPKKPTPPTNAQRAYLARLIGSQEKADAYCDGASKQEARQVISALVVENKRKAEKVAREEERQKLLEGLK